MQLVAFYEHKVRELSSLRRLRERLRSDGHEMAIYSIAFEWHDAYAFAKKKRVDALLLPWCYMKEQFWRYSPFIELNPSIKLINLHHEQVTARITESVLLPRDSVAKSYPYHFCWSDYFQKLLVDDGVDSKRTFVVGNIRASLISQQNDKREEVATKYHLDPSKKWILFAESRRIDSISMEKNKADFTALGKVNKKDCDAFFERWKISLGVFVQQIHTLPNAFFDRFEFIYRPHPGSTIEFDLGKRAHIIFEGPISKWLSCVDVFCTWQSTSAFEAEIAGLPVLIHECIAIPENERMPGLDGYQSIKHLNQITEEAINLAHEQQEAAPVYPKYFGNIGDEVIDRYATAIEEIMSKQEQLQAVPYDKTWIAKMRYSEIVVKILKRLNLIKKIGWPKTASMMYEDIPFGDAGCRDLHI